MPKYGCPFSLAAMVIWGGLYCISYRWVPIKLLLLLLAVVNTLFGCSSRARGRLHFMTQNLIDLFDGLILYQLTRVTVLGLGQTTGD